jgi:hypothetical protein
MLLNNKNYNLIKRNVIHVVRLLWASPMRYRIYDLWKTQYTNI